MDCSGAAKAASTPQRGWSPANPAGLKSTSVTARKRSSALLKHINGDYSLVEVEGNTAVITANSSYFAINQDHIRSPDQPGTIDYTAAHTAAVAKLYIRLCHHRPGYTRHNPDCPSTGAAVADITCCRCFRIWIYVVGAPENYPHFLWVFFPS